MSKNAEATRATAPYYAETAFDSREIPESLPRKDLSDKTAFMRKAHGRPLNLSGVQCREFTASSDEVGMLESFQKRTATQKGVFSLGLADKYYHRNWAGGLEIASVLAYVYFFAPILTVLAIVHMGIILVLMGLSDRGQEFIRLNTIYLAVFGVIWFVSHTIIHKGWARPKRDTRLIRPTGMVSFWGGRSKGRVEKPFIDFEPYVRRLPTYGGGSYYQIVLLHRTEDIVITTPDSPREHWEVMLAWEELYRFMDTSQPLPDTPEYECTRHLDPVTADHDRRHGRPERYWRELDPERGREIKSLAIAAA
ncbi:hypothetical protein SAMN04488052_101948, partial [Aquisalimonas asiatica]